MTDKTGGEKATPVTVRFQEVGDFRTLEAVSDITDTSMSRLGEMLIVKGMREILGENPELGEFIEKRNELRAAQEALQLSLSELIPVEE